MGIFSKKSRLELKVVNCPRMKGSAILSYKILKEGPKLVGICCPLYRMDKADKFTICVGSERVNYDDNLRVTFSDKCSYSEEGFKEPAI